MAERPGVGRTPGLLMPVVVSSNPVSTIRRVEIDAVLAPENWRQRINAIGWYDQASFGITGYRDVLERWFYDRLGWHAVRVDPTGLEREPVFEGMIWSMTLALPGLSQTRTLDDMYNRVAVRYTSTNFATNPPTIGSSVVTADANDSDSQNHYGIRQIVLNRGMEDATMAAQERDAWLAEYTWPKARRDPGVGSSASLMVELRGYWHTLDWRIYSQTATSGQQNASTQIGDIVTAVGQYIASTQLSTNTTQINRYFDPAEQVRTARELIEWIAGLGDASSNRWLAGVGASRRLYYRQAATAIGYARGLSDAAGVIYSTGDRRRLEPWQVRPDTWLRTTDVAGLAVAGLTDRDRDPQLSYVESVEWTEPFGLAITDSRAQRLAVLLARNMQYGEELIRAGAPT